MEEKRVFDLVDHLRDQRSLTIVCHDDPDPDCLASAYALESLAGSVGVSEVRIMFGDPISHQQNRAMVESLGIDLVPLSEAVLATTDLVAFVDHAIPGLHTDVSAGSHVDIVIDHHEYSVSVTADFVDLRPEYGTTSTILVEYLRDLNYQPPTPVASALLFALHRERLDHARNPTRDEYESATWLYPFVDFSLITEIYGASFSNATLDTIGKAIMNRRICCSGLTSWVGEIAEHDALPQAANFILNLENIETVLVFGLLGDAVHLSARSTDATVNIAHVLGELVGPEGRSGGHHDMAGGELPVSLFDARSQDDTLHREIDDSISDLFFHIIGYI